MTKHFRRHVDEPVLLPEKKVRPPTKQVAPIKEALKKEVPKEEVKEKDANRKQHTPG